MELLKALLHAVIIAAVPTLTTFLIQYLMAGSKKAKEATASDHVKNTIETVTNLVADVVRYVSQTYVDTLKKDGTFTKERQIEALNMAYDRALSMISDRSKETIESVFGDVGTYLLTLIEAQVGVQKKPKDSEGSLNISEPEQTQEGAAETP
ncbi:MAG: hypothetical protein ACOX63_02955 [Christensenellales bacterium]|jgi:methionyl-tRNA synthetase